MVTVCILNAKFLRVALSVCVVTFLQQPLAKLAAAQHNAPDDHIVARFARAASTNLNRTLDHLDTDEFDAVAALLGDAQRRVFCRGGRITRAHAQYLHGHLQIIRSGTALLDGSASVWPQALLDMDDTCVLVLFDIRRYEEELLRFAEQARGQGASILLFTDLWGSPIEAHAAYSFRSAVEAPSSWDSTLGLTFLLEALIAAIQSRSPEASAQRLSALEGIIGQTRIFGAG